MIPPRPPDKGKVDELTREFVAESRDGLERMELCLTELEKRPDDDELVLEIFRTVHTIKGTTSFLGFSRLQTLAHAGESLLVALRDGKIAVTTDLISALLRLMDTLRDILTLVETTEIERAQPTDDDSSLIELLSRLNIVREEASTSKTDAPINGHTLSPELPASATPVPSSNDGTLRIDVEMLNHMMNLVGELVLTRNQILQSSPDAAGFPDLARRLDTVTADLREAVRQARMQPLGHLFAKFPRMVRDLAHTCGRRVRIEFEGQETRLDKTLLEAIRDPLTHAVRNSVDHGIEPPERRLMTGKPIEGVVRLRAFQQSGSVVIEVIDDGAGIPAADVLKKAVDRNLVSAEQAAQMTDREALQLIFAPGISLSPAITHISGRGVGMDVVRSNVQKVGGSVEVESIPGSGTTLRLRMPLTLAIVPALVVRSGGQNFALPQHSLTELVHLKSCGSEAAIERIGTTEVFRLRDGLLPLVRLDKLLRLEHGESTNKGGSYIAVMEEGRRCFGLLIDDLNPPEEIVVKPLSRVLRDIGMYSGATVLGNGELALILDVKAIADYAGYRPSADAPPLADDMLQEIPNVPALAVQPSMVIYEVAKHDPNQQSNCARMAIPLSLVERIERISLDEVEYAEDKAALQYRGELISLEDHGRVLMEMKSTPAFAEQFNPGAPLAAAHPGSLAADIENIGAMITVMICLRPATPEPKRFGMVVRQVLDVSTGTLLAEDAEWGSSQLAMIDDRVATMHIAAATQLDEQSTANLQEAS
jgi:two-component system chemotaxis sensor kinase CheA